MHRKEWEYSLFGKFLGDGYVDKNRRNQMVIKHCPAQREYVWSIYRTALESNLKLSPPITQANQQEFLRIPVLARHYNFNRAWKATGDKYPSKYMLERLTPLGLLWLWLDWGTPMGLSVVPFTNKEIDKMICVLGNRFNLTQISSTPNKHVAINEQQLLDAVRPVIEYCPNEMRYKLGITNTNNDSAFPPYRYGG